MKRTLRLVLTTPICILTLFSTNGTRLSAQSAEERLDAPARKTSLAVEADASAYFLSGYSGIARLSLRNGFNVALGTGRYDVPSFVLSGDANYESVKWKATAESIQVFRMGYRWKGPMKNGPVTDVIVLNQNWRLHSERLPGDTHFRLLGVGLSGGYYFHIGKHFYLYPTASFTWNTVYSGVTSLQGTSYHLRRWQPNGSLHVGWEWGL